MKTKTIKLYEYSELSKEAKGTALANFLRVFDEYGLAVHLDNLADDVLKKRGVTPVTDLKGYPTKHAKLFYSLTNSQGDGLMFEGVFAWKNLIARVKHSGHYTHSLSKEVELTDTTRDGEEATDEQYKAFEVVYQKICKELEKAGYSYIDDVTSEAYFIEECNANEWTFRKDGTKESLDD